MSKNNMSMNFHAVKAMQISDIKDLGTCSITGERISCRHVKIIFDDGTDEQEISLFSRKNDGLAVQ